MNTIREFAAEDATVIFGTVCEESIGDALRVTVVATGLGKAAARKAAPLTVLRSGTDNLPAAGAAAPHAAPHDYSHLETPAVWRSRDGAAVRAAVEDAAVERLDIPAFLRKQAD